MWGKRGTATVSEDESCVRVVSYFILFYCLFISVGELEYLSIVSEVSGVLICNK